MKQSQKHEEKIKNHLGVICKNDIDNYAKQIAVKVVIRRARTNNGIVTWFYNFPDKSYSSWVET